jgi:hypothetical protein
MSNGSGVVVFYKEVLDAISRNPSGIADLIVLRDLCSAVDASNKTAASRLTRELAALTGTDDPLHDISYELFHALLARILLRGWFDEFDILMDWKQTLFGTRDLRAADNWHGINELVREKPQTLGLLTLANREEEWKRALSGLDGAIRHFAKVRLPTQMAVGAPPAPIEYREVVLPQRLAQSIELFFRVLQMIFQQILELSLKRLEQDQNDAGGLRKLQQLQVNLWRVLTAQDKRPEESPPKSRLDTILRASVRVAEVRYGRGRAKLHRFLDAFPPHDQRSVIFSSLDREDRDEPYVRGEMLGSIQVSRDRQLGFYLATYGHAWDARESPHQWHLQRRALISVRHGGKLELIDNDDFVDFLGNYFEARLTELSAQNPSASGTQAAVEAWGETVNEWSLLLSQTCSHSRLNLTEGPPNYLTHAFPRNIVGRLLHDCGVYAVRGAFVLLSVLDRINRTHSGMPGTVSARWVRFPLHVGLLIESSSFGLVVQHNENAMAFDHAQLQGHMANWRDNRPSFDSDPSDPDAEKLKFHEDVAANGFSSDLDMPVTSVPVLGGGEAVTPKTVWTSYQKKVVPSQLFTRLVGTPNTPQYQFDNRYLRLSELEREWYNEYVLQFWNKDCNDIWQNFKKTLTDTKINDNSTELAKHKQAYARQLNAALDKVEDSYLERILPQKQALSSGLRADGKLLLPGVRIVASVRLEAFLPVGQKTIEHIDEISDPKFKFPRDFVPPFARPEEALLEVP